MINSQNNDINECFKCCLVRHLYPEDHHPARIPKADKDFAGVLYLKDIIFPVKIRDIYKIEKTNSIGISVFGYENKEKYPIYVSNKRCENKHVDLLMIGKGKKSTMFLWKISIHSYMIMYCIMEENIFVAIVSTLLEQKKNWNVTLNIASKLMVTKQSKCLSMVNILNSKI